MGVYDTFIFACVYCGEDSQSQTKLGENNLENIGIGQLFRSFVKNTKILLKNPCHKCGRRNVAIIVNNVFKGVEKQGNEHIIENYFGDYEEVKK